MAGLELGAMPAGDRRTAEWASALLVALAREENRGRRTRRLTEANHETWKRFRGRLTATDFVGLLFEDAAVTHPLPFDPLTLGGDLVLNQLPNPMVDGWLQTLLLNSKDPELESLQYIQEQARLLRLPTRLARTDLHAVKPHQKVLELPGSGGQLAHHLATSNAGLSLQSNVIIGCNGWNELTLAGLVAVELGSPNTDMIRSDAVLTLQKHDSELRQMNFDVVVGLHPDKGGLFRREDQLDLWFPRADIQLV